MVISTKKIGLSPRQDFEEIAFFQVFIDRSSSLRIDASDRGGGPDNVPVVGPDDFPCDDPGGVGLT